MDDPDLNGLKGESDVHYRQGLGFMAAPMDVRDSDYNVHRLNALVPGVREFQAAYERAVREVPADDVLALVEEGAPWSQMLELIEESAPYGFLIYFRNDVHRVMKAAGDEADCIQYLMGNHTIAERMFRYGRASAHTPGCCPVRAPRAATTLQPIINST